MLQYCAKIPNAVLICLTLPEKDQIESNNFTMSINKDQEIRNTKISSTKWNKSKKYHVDSSKGMAHDREKATH